MTTLVKPYTFLAGTTAQSAQVNSNFDTIVSWINTNAIQRDGSVAMTGLLSLSGGDPSSTNHATRKGYTDRYGLAKNYFVNTVTMTGQNNGAPVMVLDTASGLGTPNYAYRMLVFAHIMQKGVSDGHNYYKITFGPTSTTSIVLNANGSSDRHNAFTQAGKWESAGTMVASTTQASATAARWRLWNENNDVFGTTDFTVVTETIILPNPV